jgi:hypothetical protein
MGKTAKTASRNGQHVRSSQGAISQAELEEFKALKARSKSMAESVQAKRDSLRRRLEAGAPVEPGRLQATVRSSDHHRLTSTELERLLGRSRVDELKKQVIPTLVRQLWVKEDS